MFKVILSIVFVISIVSIANAESKVQSLHDHGYDNPEQSVCD